MIHSLWFRILSLNRVGSLQMLIFFLQNQLCMEGIFIQIPGETIPQNTRYVQEILMLLLENSHGRSLLSPLETMVGRFWNLRMLEMSSPSAHQRRMLRPNDGCHPCMGQQKRTHEVFSLLHQVFPLFPLVQMATQNHTMLDSIHLVERVCQHQWLQHTRPLFNRWSKKVGSLDIMKPLLSTT